ncbi:MAG: MauE/DoxX family redox-associated membrane protein [Bacteroidota bacterium]
MTLTKLTIGVAIAAVVLTAIVAFINQRQRQSKRQSYSVPISYLQNFCGALFVFSGFVKAMDPLGTAYKLEQYFAEFESTFEPTWFSFLAPMFPALSEFSVALSVGVVVFEIVLGIMLLIGAARKFTSWAFFLLVLFFTFLTGFTYLTGYVPGEDILVLEDTDGNVQRMLVSEYELNELVTPRDTVTASFFNFSLWGDYNEANMKVTDCGCFGDFLKLQPKVSFFKDIFLLIPAIIFLFAYGRMHQLFSPAARGGILVLSTVGLVLYSMMNYVWDLPGTDFRPFKKGVNVAEQKAYEAEATAVKVIGYKLTNKASGEVTELEMADYLKRYKEFPKEEWEYDQLRSEPEMEPTKISDFAIEHYDGYEVTEDLLSDPNYSLMIVAHKFYIQDTEQETYMRRDSIYVTDTVDVNGTPELVRRLARVVERPVTKSNYTFDEKYMTAWRNVVNPVMQEATAAGWNVYAVTKPYETQTIDDFSQASNANYPFYKADDILLKTIVRSNPGVILWKEGVILNKWHYKKLPSFEEIKSEAEAAILSSVTE